MTEIDSWKSIDTISARSKQNSELDRRHGDEEARFHLARVSQKAIVGELGVDAATGFGFEVI